MVRPENGIVLSCVGGRYRVHSAGETILASMRGRIKRHSEEKILVGDVVEVERHDADSATIERVLPRRSLLRRRSPGRSGGIRAVAANIDQVVVVGSARRPDWDPHTIDRFIAVAEASDLPAIVVLNKLDLYPEGGSFLEVYRAAGYQTMSTSVPETAGVGALRDALNGRVSLFTGPSGVGKSSLLNLIDPALKLRTGSVSEKAGAGRHTTVSAEMHPIGEASFVVDTPGLRDIGLWGVSPAEVAGAFPDLLRIAQQCHFDNCRHVAEPGCAVVGAVARNELSESRLASYRQLLEEASIAARSWA
jgi:ribosome biogenesis GTPase